MAQIGKLETEVAVKAPADKFFDVIRKRNYRVPDAASDKIQKVEVKVGDWESNGSIKFWKYTIGDKVETLKEKVEIDDANKIITLTALEGNCLEQYKTYKIIFHVIPKNDGSLVKIKAEYEKLKDCTPDPNSYLEFMVNVVKDVDAHIDKN